MNGGSDRDRIRAVSVRRLEPSDGFTTVKPSVRPFMGPLSERRARARVVTDGTKGVWNAFLSRMRFT